MSFLESPRFPEEISFWAVGGPRFNTTVITVDNGEEYRNQNWDQARAVYAIGEGMKVPSEFSDVQDFFYAMKGRFNGFRFKDWRDYTVAQARGRLGSTSTGGDWITYPMYKRYTVGGYNYDRRIKKPVSGAVTVYKNGVALTINVNFTVDTTTGIVTFLSSNTKNISGISKANPGVITFGSAHSYTTGQRVYLSSINGMTQLNGAFATVTVVDSTHISIGINTSSYSTYTSGGTVQMFPQDSDTLAWSGEFDVPVRFDSDGMDNAFDPGGLVSWENIKLVELRINE